MFAFVVYASSATVFAADQFNDAYYLTEADGPLDLSGEVEGGGSNTEESNNSSEPSNASNSSPNSSNSENSSENSNSSESSNNSNSSESNSSSEGSGGSASETAGSGGASVESEEEVLSVFETEGAVSMSGGGGGGIGSITIDGAEVRRALRENADIGDVLAHWRSVAGRKSRNVGAKLTTGEYYSLVAATLAGDDDKLDGATFDGIRFGITYRSRGALFAFIPWSFPVHVTVEATAVSAQDRVQVRFPWYHWFMREYFTREGLASEIDSIVTKELREADPETEEDIHARLFVAVAQFLRLKVRTISDSILLGAQ